MPDAVSDFCIFGRLRYHLAKAIGIAICEPKLRLGRRRHDDVCDQCEQPIKGMHAMDGLSFPLDDYSPDASSSREKLGAMLDAKYVRVCLECSADLESASDVKEVSHRAE